MELAGNYVNFGTGVIVLLNLRVFCFVIHFLCLYGNYLGAVVLGFGISSYLRPCRFDNISDLSKMKHLETS